MNDPSNNRASALAPKVAAPQHKPRPLTLFLELVREQTAGDPHRLAKVLRGLRAYQEMPRDQPPEPMPVLAKTAGSAVRDYGGGGKPVLFVPSLINPPNVLDLRPDRSLLRWLAERGHRVLLLDWGWDVAARCELSVAGHVEEILLPFIAGLGEPPALVGYCLGGTMALAAAARSEVKALVTIAAPWHFAGYPQDARRMLLDLWARSRGTAEELGLLPMEALQSAFWSLDPERTVSKFERFADIDPKSAAARSFTTLEDWANDGPPLPYAAAREMFEALFEQDLSGSGDWRVADDKVDPRALACPLLNIVSTSDRIVPHQSRVRAGEQLELAQGHVGMIVGSHAQRKVWQPLDTWLSRAPAS